MKTLSKFFRNEAANRQHINGEFGPLVRMNRSHGLYQNFFEDFVVFAHIRLVVPGIEPVMLCKPLTFVELPKNRLEVSRTVAVEKSFDAARQVTFFCLLEQRAVPEFLVSANAEAVT